MNRRPLLLALALVALAVTIARAVVTHDGVGVLEYATSVALIGLLLLGAFRLTRRAIDARG